jgi:hypothetical protein
MRSAQPCHTSGVEGLVIRSVWPRRPQQTWSGLLFWPGVLPLVAPERRELAPLLPVYGPAGLAVVRRVGHLHVTIDDSPWHWVNTSGEPIVIHGLPPGGTAS